MEKDVGIAEHYPANHNDKDDANPQKFGERIKT